MKDIELLDILFQYMYNNGELLYYERAFREAGIDENQITIQLLFKLNRLLKASGFVNETNKRVEGFPEGLKLKSEGMNMLLEYGSYGKYLEEKRKEKKREQKIKKSTIQLNYATIIISMGTFIGGILLSNQAKALWKLFLSIFE